MSVWSVHSGGQLSSATGKSTFTFNKSFKLGFVHRPCFTRKALVCLENLLFWNTVTDLLTSIPQATQGSTTWISVSEAHKFAVICTFEGSLSSACHNLQALILWTLQRCDVRPWAPDRRVRKSVTKPRIIQKYSIWCWEQNRLTHNECAVWL